MAAMSSDRQPPNPSGLCKCGCGARTPVAPQGDTRRGWVRGEHVRYVPGHSAARAGRPYKQHYRPEDRGHSTPCWTWLLATQVNGYGVVRKNGRNHAAHRWYYEQEHGPIPEGHVIHHACENKNCVNPAHLEAVTNGENVRRSRRGKLTLEEVDQVVGLARGGWVKADIARAYGITGSYVTQLERAAS